MIKKIIFNQFWNAIPIVMLIIMLMIGYITGHSDGNSNCREAKVVNTCKSKMQKELKDQEFQKKSEIIDLYCKIYYRF